MRGAQHGEHQDEHRHRIVGETFAEHLAQARTIGNHRDLLAIGAAEHFGAHQRIFAEQRQVIDLVPAVAFRDFQQGLIIQARCFAAFEGQHLIGLGQWLTDRPGFKQLCLGLRRGL
ncbi:hypothetical protein D3C85_855090 [compost metagenome]